MIYDWRQRRTLRNISKKRYTRGDVAGKYREMEAKGKTPPSGSAVPWWRKRKRPKPDISRAI